MKTCFSFLPIIKTYVHTLLVGNMYMCIVVVPGNRHCTQSMHASHTCPSLQVGHRLGLKPHHVLGTGGENIAINFNETGKSGTDTFLLRNP